MRLSWRSPRNSGFSESAVGSVWVPQVGVIADLCVAGGGKAQVSEYRDLWHHYRNSMSDADNPIRNISDTARWAAVYRARETERADAVFLDPLARKLAGERGER